MSKRHKKTVSNQPELPEYNNLIVPLNVLHVSDSLHSFGHKPNVDSRLQPLISFLAVSNVLAIVGSDLQMMQTSQSVSLFLSPRQPLSESP